MINFEDKRVKFLIDTVRQACYLVKTIQKELVLPAITKEDRSPVTVADFAVQALVGKLLKETFADDIMVGEEDSAALKSLKPNLAPSENASESSHLKKVTSFVGRFVEGVVTDEMVCEWIDYGKGAAKGRFWTLDPVDGTKGFLRGDQYVAALALIEGGRVQIGALGCPNLRDGYLPDFSGDGSLVVAVRGQGAWTMPPAHPYQVRPLSVSDCQEAAEARVLRSFESGHTNVDQIEQFTQVMGIIARPVKMDSQAKYAVLAAGHGELMLRLLSAEQPDYKEKIWDQAAGSIIVEEAGGMVTDIRGKPFDFTTGRKLVNNRGVLVSNGHLHQMALDALAKIKA